MREGRAVQGRLSAPFWPLESSRQPAEAAAGGVPKAVQVADDFHMLKSLYDALEKPVEHNRHVRTTSPSAELR